MTDTNNILGENMLPLAEIAKPVFNITPPHCPAQGGHQHPARPGISHWRHPQGPAVRAQGRFGEMGERASGRWPWP